MSFKKQRQEFFENFTNEEKTAFFGTPINNEIFKEFFYKKDQKEEYINDIDILNEFTVKNSEKNIEGYFSKILKVLIIQHDGKFRLIFDLLILMAIAFNCISVMYFVSFSAEIGILTTYFNIFLDIFYGVSILLNFFTTYKDPMSGEYIVKHKLIALNYIKGWLLFDIISMIRIENKSTIFKFFRLIRLPKLLRLIDSKVIGKLFEDLFVNSKSNSLLIVFNLKYAYKIIRLVIIAIAITYCVACSWWFLIQEYVLPTNQDNNFIKFAYSGFFKGTEPKSGYDKLAISAYYTLTTLTTVGYGDFYPQNNSERLLAIFIMLIGVSLFTYVMGNFTDLITTYDKKLGAVDNASNLHNWLTLLHNFSKNVQFDNKLLNKIDLHFNYFWKKDRNTYLTKDDPYLNSLPKSMRIKLVEFMWGDILNNFSHFLMYDKVNRLKYHKIYYDLVFNLLPRRFLQQEMIFSTNEEIEEMYLILSGEVEIGCSLHKDRHNIKYAVTLSKVQSIGMYYSLYNLKSNYYYRAKSEVTCFGINKLNLIKSFEKYPEFMKEIKQRTKERYIKKIWKQLEKVRDEEISNLNKINMDLKIEKKNKFDEDVENSWKLKKHMKNKINQKQNEIKNILYDIEKKYIEINNEYFNISEKLKELENVKGEKVEKIYLNLKKINDNIEKKISWKKNQKQ